VNQTGQGLAISIVEHLYFGHTSVPSLIVRLLSIDASPRDAVPFDESPDPTDEGDDEKRICEEWKGRRRG